MNKNISDGVWPTMITPFTDLNKIDYKGVEALIEWYIKKNVNGIFAVCQSSEMFFLSLKERIKLAKYINEKVDGRVSVIASGHISDDINDQIEEIKAMSDTGVNAVVLVSNGMALEEEGDDVWKENVEKILNNVPDVPLGIYECPYPYKRLLSPELMEWCASTERFVFLKETSCNLKMLKAKSKVAKKSNFKIYNANSATLLKSLEYGIAGYSGVMGNFHPELYRWLLRNWAEKPRAANKLQNFLGLASVIDRQFYPVNAKYFLYLEGIDILTNSRVLDSSKFSTSNKLEVKQFHTLSNLYSKEYYKKN